MIFAIPANPLAIPPKPNMANMRASTAKTIIHVIIIFFLMVNMISMGKCNTENLLTTK